MSNLPIGVKLKKAREAADLTQEELADKAGYSKSYISLVEANKSTPSVKALNKLSAVLKVDPKYFLEEGHGVFFEEYQEQLSLEENDFIKSQKFRPWITLATEFDKNGLTPESLKDVLKIAMRIKEEMSKKEAP